MECASQIELPYTYKIKIGKQSIHSEIYGGVNELARQIYHILVSNGAMEGGTAAEGVAMAALGEGNGKHSTDTNFYFRHRNNNHPRYNNSQSQASLEGRDRVTPSAMGRMQASTRSSVATAALNRRKLSRTRRS